MKIPTKNASAFARSLWLTVLSFIVLSIAFAVYVHSEKQIDDAHEKRTQSLLLAVEFRQSSEQLTNMARAFIITGVPAYRERYEEFIDIQNGNRARPADFNHLHRELSPAAAGKPQAERLPAMSFLERARRIGVTEQEFERLRQAKEKSDQLTAIEYTAMDTAASTLGSTEPKQQLARTMLFDEVYVQLKDDILQLIADFYRMVDARTLRTLDEQMDDARGARIVFVLFGGLLLLALWHTYRSLRATLGGTPDELHYRLSRMGQGDFSPDSGPPMNGEGNSILAWLLETQKNLARTDAVRKNAEAKERRLTGLYKALGQCNEAIMRCTTEEELFAQVCKNIVSAGGMDMAWIGLLEGKRIRPVSSYGAGADYAAEIDVSIDESEAIGRGPTATCFREDRPVWCQDFQHDPITVPWRANAERFSWRASAALPLHRAGQVSGVLCMYATVVNAFGDAARELLTKLAVDIDYALNRIESERQRDQAVTALTDSRRMLRTIIDSTPIRIFWKDLNLRYIGCNRAFVEDTTMSSPQEVIGKDDYQLVWREYAERYRESDRKVLATGKPRLAYEEPYCTATGKEGWVRTSKVPLLDEGGRTIGVLGLYEDITEQKRTAEHIHYLANYDTLTGLPSRAGLNERLDYALQVARRTDEPLTLMFLDMDNFKDINDALGHTVGDAVLVELAGRLLGVVREEDTVARFGGDEFVLLLPNTDDRRATFLAQKLLDAIAEPYRIDRYSLSLAASIGIAIFPRDGPDVETLFKSADAAMYYAKKGGRRGYRFSAPSMQERSARNLQLVSAMNDALDHDLFEVYFQPQISLRDARIVGAEALLRWKNAEFGVISPCEFMPVAEDSGLIQQIGEKVLRKAVRQARSWQDEGTGLLTVGVNLSFTQFCNPGLPALVARILAEEGLPAEYLDLELTESSAMNNPESAIAMMEQLHARGVQISIDDFGTGYSSLSYLKKFRLHKLKIDQSFVRDITTDPEDKAIVGAIIQMANQLGLRTIAEGVETGEQLQYLKEQGCNEVQGYYYSRPLSSDDFSRFVRDYRGGAAAPPADQAAASC